MKTDLSSAKHSRSEIEQALREAGVTGFKGKVCKCPFHEDAHASAGIYESADGWRFKCQVPTCGVTGDVFDIRARNQGKTIGEILKAENPNQVVEALKSPPPKRTFPTVDAIRNSVSHIGTVEAIYCYTNPKTNAVDIAQVRYVPCDEDRKKFLVHHGTPSGFVMGAPPKPWPIYNRSRLINANTVVIVEGEKCVHALHDVGIVGTCSLSGAGNAKHADWSPLAGKTVFIWPDNDDSGLKYAAEVSEMLDLLTPRPTIWLLNVSGLGLEKGGDVFDFITDGASASDVWTVLRDGSELVGSSADLHRRVQGIIDGTYASIEWVRWPVLTRIAKALFPGTITVICGDPGSSKSFMVLEAFFYLHSKGHKVALYELEEDRAYHLHRLLALLAESWNILDDDWCRTNQQFVQDSLKLFSAQIDGFARSLFSAPVGTLRYAELLEWIESQCKSGARVIAIDPITAVATSENRQSEDLSFIVKATQILRANAACMILVTHPRTAGGRGQKGMDDLAGGRAFSRNTQTVLWLHRHDPPKKFNCINAVGAAVVECNRSVVINKARNGPGQGKRIGFTQGAAVQMAEQGIVAGEADA